MQRIVLDRDLYTGNRYMDLQHHELIDIINDLAEAIGQSASTSQMREVLTRLEQYSRFHFAHEEREIRRNSVATTHAEAHVAQHREFAQHVRTAVGELDEIGLITASDANALLYYLTTWLTNHIADTDKKLATILRALTLPTRDFRSGGTRT